MMTVVVARNQVVCRRPCGDFCQVSHLWKSVHAFGQRREVTVWLLPLLYPPSLYWHNLKNNPVAENSGKGKAQAASPCEQEGA